MSLKIKFIASFIFLQASLLNYCVAQIIVGATWTFVVEQTDDKEATLVLTATIKDKFHIYS